MFRYPNHLLKLILAFYFFHSDFSFAQTGRYDDPNKVKIELQKADIKQNILPYRKYDPVINDEKTYNEIVKGEKQKIDFTKYTLLGRKVISMGCKKPDITYSLYFFPKDSIYYYDLEVKENGDCKKYFTSVVWYIAPKIENANKLRSITYPIIKVNGGK